MSANRCEVETDCQTVSRLDTAVPREQRVRKYPILAVVGEFFQRVAQTRRRGAAIRELSQLDDQQLHDMGIERDQIPQVVSRMLRRETS